MVPPADAVGLQGLSGQLWRMGVKPLLSGTAGTRALRLGDAGHTPLPVTLPPRWASATQGGPELLAAPVMGEQRLPLRTKRDRSVKKEAAGCSNLS